MDDMRQVILNDIAESFKDAMEEDEFNILEEFGFESPDDLKDLGNRDLLNLYVELFTGV